MSEQLFSGLSKDALEHLIYAGMLAENPGISKAQAFSWSRAALGEYAAHYYQKGYQDAPHVKPQTLGDLLLGDDE